MGQIENTANFETSGRLLNGYQKSVSGQTLDYRSSHPDAHSSLLARAKRGIRTIAWETEILPKNFEGDHYTFIWLAGLAGSMGVHQFEFSINGEHALSFETAPDSTRKQWTVAGKKGTALSFNAVSADQFGDLFGYMYLKVPKGEYQTGEPLELQVVGEDADSPAWYMTFKYGFHFEPHFRVEPALIREGNEISQLLRLSIDNLKLNRTMEVLTPGGETLKARLQIGANIFQLPIPSVSSPQNISIQLKVDDEPFSEKSIKVEPVTQRDIYILSYSHNDIGYTDIQKKIERKQWQHLDQALALIQKTDNFPEEARYKWNIEVLWAFESYLEQASDEKRDDVIKAIQSGSIGLNALYGNMLTGLANATEMTHFLDFARSFTKKNNIPITTALVSDVPGFSWGLVTALAQSGVKYFASAPNAFDRIGHTLETWGDKPFYWVSQSGEEKVLTWVAGASYSSFHEGEMTALGHEKILKLTRRLKENKYPYSIVQLPYTIGGDNGPPDPNLPNFIKHWNEKYISPKLILSTHEEMFRNFEQKYGADLPTLSGDFTPYWEDGAASTALETAANMNTKERLIQSEALWSLLAPHNFPADAHTAAWRDAIFYDEHTWGAFNSVSEPDLPFVKQQWQRKSTFAMDADSSSRALLSRALAPTPKSPSTKTAFDIFNTSSWLRSDVVIISAEQSEGMDLVVDEEGTSLPSQRLSTGELAFQIKAVPALSAKRVYLRTGDAAAGGQAKAGGNTLENDLIRLSIDKTTGAIDEFIWKKSGVQLSGDHGLNAYSYIPGKDPQQAQHLRQVKIRIKEQGGLLAALVIEAEAPGCNRFSTEIRIYEGLERVDIWNELDKRAIREKEAVHFAFPFNVPQGQLRYDVASSIVKPEENQLAGSCKNFYSVQGFVDVSNENYGLTWATVDAPLIEIGAINAEKPWLKRNEPSQTFYSYAMNNYWHTNYKADQEGTVSFRYAMQPHQKYRAERAVQFSIERRQPLIVAPANAASPPAMSLFQLAPSSVIATSIKPIESGRAWLLTLYNPTNAEQTATVNWNKAIPVAFFQSTAFGDAGEHIEDGFAVPAFGSRIIRVEKR